MNSFSLFHLPILGTRNALKQCVHESRSATPQTQPTRFQLLEKRIERFPDHPHLNRWLRAGNFFGKPNEQKAVSGKLLYFCTFFFYNFHTKAHKKAVMSAAQPTDAVVASATPTTVAASTTAVAAATTPATTAGEPVTPTKTPMPPKEKRPEGGPKTPKSKDVIINTQEIPGGGKIEMRANGSILQTNADGSTIETWKDSERRHETTPNGDWMEVKEDGTHIQYSKEQKVKISKFKNGSELQENDDGSTIETDSEGMIIEKMGNIYIEIRTDGSRLQKDGETGISIEKFGDGTTVQVRFQFVCHTIQFMVPSLVHAWFSFVWSWKHLFLLIFMFINFLFSFLFSRAPPKKKKKDHARPHTNCTTSQWSRDAKKSQRHCHRNLERWKKSTNFVGWCTH